LKVLANKIECRIISSKLILSLRLAWFKMAKIANFRVFKGKKGRVWHQWACMERYGGIWKTDLGELAGKIIEE
jgi:hypothetical protein